MREQHSLARDRFLAGLLSLLTVVSSGWVGDGLNGVCLWEPFIGACAAGAHPSLAVRVVVAGLLFWAAVFLLFRTAKRLLPVRHLARTPSVSGHKVLIAAISPLKPKPMQKNGHWVVIEGDKRVVLSGNLKEDIDAFTALAWRWNGQQFLRSLKPHTQTLRHLVLIGSPGDWGSFGSLESAKALVSLYATQADVLVHPDPIGPEDIEGLQTCFDHYIEHFHGLDVPQREIILDSTGGQKTTSIAAALTTLRWEGIEFQYVQTEGDPPGSEIRAIGFNLLADSSRGSPSA